VDATRYIGRVGVMAAALGLGAALSTGAGIAWAEGGVGGSDNGANGSDGASDAAPRRAQAGQLSALTDRVRKEVDAGLEGRADAVKRVQSSPEMSRTRLGDGRAELRAKLEESTRSASPRALPLAGLRQTVGKAEGRRLVPEAVDAVPDLHLPERPSAAVVKVAEATKDVWQRAADAIASARGALPPPSALSLDAAPVTAFAASITPALSKTIDVPEISGTALMSGLLAAAGLSPLAGDGPLTPGPSPLALAVMAWARRESARAVNPSGTSLAPAAGQVSTLAEGQAAPVTAATAVWRPDPGLTVAPVISGDATAEQVGWTTGPNTNTAHWYIAGSDLGIMWDSGYTDPQTGQPVVYTMFGDTYSEPGMSGDWRNNVLLRSSDTDLSDGLQFSDALIDAGASPTNPGTPQWYPTTGPRAGAAQVIDDPGFNGLFGSTHTMIPTSAIAVQHEDGSITQYATVMSVRTWDNPGSWTTNYSAIAYSTDGGETWTVDPDTVRSSGWLRASTRYAPGDEHFQQNALVYGNPDDPNSYTGPADDPNREPYVYVYGTPSGRQGSAYLARVPESQLRDLDAYQYWAGENPDGTGNWVTGDPSAAVPVIGASQDDFLPRLYNCFDTFTFGWFSKILNGIWVGGLPTGGNVSEMSVQYNEHLDRYIVTYTDGGNSVVMRVSDSPQGSWSNSTTLVRNTGIGQSSGMYAPMIHPLSGTAALGQGNEKYLYFNLSQWGDYNVRMMQADLSNLTIT